MYNLLDLESESSESISEIQKEKILALYSLMQGYASQYIQLADLNEILKDTFYYVGVEYFVIKGKSSFYKGVIVVASKENLVAYLVRIIQLNDCRSVFIIPKNHQNLLISLDDEGCLMLSRG